MDIYPSTFLLLSLCISLPLHILPSYTRGNHTFLAIPIMLLTTTIILQVSLLAVVLACRDSAHGNTDHDHHDNVHSTKAVPTRSLPTRPLQWGDVNIIHTTDSHGWMLGHQKSSFPEPNYRCVEPSGWNKIDSEELIPSSGDLGDFASFVAHMKTIAIVCV